MKKFLVTGICGFVGRYCWEYLLSYEKDFILYGIDVAETPPWVHDKFIYIPLNMMDVTELKKIIREVHPDYIVHLAAFSSVSDSWRNPKNNFHNNVSIFLNLIEAVHEESRNTRILSVGSSEIYGTQASDFCPLTENLTINPSNPYAVARATQEMFSKIFVSEYKLNIIITRSFNHTGPRQSDKFLVPSLVKQFIHFSNGSDPVLHVGNLHIIRDFLDVRDVVVAYFKILYYGKIGSIYNVCSGRGISLNTIVEKLSKMCSIYPDIVVDKKLLRPNDAKVIVGSNALLSNTLRWVPKISFDKTLKDMIGYHKNMI